MLYFRDDGEGQRDAEPPQEQAHQAVEGQAVEGQPVEQAKPAKRARVHGKKQDQSQQKEQPLRQQEHPPQQQDQPPQGIEHVQQQQSQQVAEPEIRMPDIPLPQEHQLQALFGGWEMVEVGGPCWRVMCIYQFISLFS